MTVSLACIRWRCAKHLDLDIVNREPPTHTPTSRLSVIVQSSIVTPAGCTSYDTFTPRPPNIEVGIVDRIIVLLTVAFEPRTKRPTD
ncbi:MAG: hypothetical protein U0165_03985 [Polyangiaceae bacterium]